MGIGGNVLSRSFETLGGLATHGFFKNLWQLLSRYGVTLHLPLSTEIPLLREDDRPFMEAVSSTGLFTTEELIGINRFRHWKKVHSIGDLVSCDGLTVKPSMLTSQEGSSDREFPVQKPVRSALVLWKKALGSITLRGTKLRTPLGSYTGVPHQPDKWFMGEESSDIYHFLPEGSSEVYKRPNSGRTTRFGTVYILSDSCITQPAITHRVSIRAWNGTTLRYHSSQPIWSPREVEVPRTLQATLTSWDNPSLWKHLRIDGNDEGWIFRGLMRGSMTIGHDGSYMPMVANNVCSCAVVFYCSHEDKYADVTWVERSTKKSADNYRAEILGGCCAQLVVKAAISGRNMSGAAKVRYGCDNMGVVLHGTHHKRPLLEKQAQSDVLRYFKQLVGSSRIRGEIHHVYGHTDEHLRRDQMTPAQQVNVRADELASSALMEAVRTQQFIKSLFPSEGVSLMIGETRITGSPKSTITHLWGEQVAQDLFHRRNIVHTNDFALVYWEGMEREMKAFPEMFRVWITKQVSHFNGTNRMLSRFPKTATREAVKNRCPSCGCFDESTKHITRCRHPGRSSVFAESIESLDQWMRCQDTNPEVVYLFRTFLLGRGTRTMTSILRPGSRLRLVAQHHDRLGWDNFLEGRICALWVELRARDLKERKLEQSADHWARGLMRRLLEIVHQQWLYRNATVHMKLKDGITSAQHILILKRIEECLEIDPEELLKKNKDLLYADFTQLAIGPVKNKLEWIAEMDSGMRAAEHVVRGSRQTVRTRYCAGSRPWARLEYEAVLVDGEGSMKWRRRRKRV